MENLIGNRIKERRKQLKLSQEELALMLGYKSKSSINKIELGGRDLPLSKVQQIANALNTSPSYLMGWKEEANIGEEVMKLFNTMNEEGQAVVLNIIKGLAPQYRKESK